MDLFIIRHAWAGHYGDPDWPDDSQRPLTEDGKRRFARVVEALAQRDFRPQIIATSPLVRCRQTADIMAESISACPDVVELSALEPGGDPQALLRWTIGQAEQYEGIAWVGHAPDVGRLTATMIGDPGGWVRLAKGAVAAIRFDDLPEVGSGELRWLVTAKQLGC